MLKRKSSYLAILLWMFVISCNNDNTDPEEKSLQLSSIKIGTISLDEAQTVEQVEINIPIVIEFVAALNTQSVSNNLTLEDGQGKQIALELNFENENKKVIVNPQEPLQNNQVYIIKLGKITGVDNDIFTGAEFSFKTVLSKLILKSIAIDNDDFAPNGRITDIKQDFTITATFSKALNPNNDLSNIVRLFGSGSTSLQFTYEENNTKLIIKPTNTLKHLSRYTFQITNKLVAGDESSFDGFSNIFYTEVDDAPKFPIISDDELLTLVQRQTFKYFWDFAHPVSGLIRERNTSGDLVTSGGSGFGVMSILVGIERGFITRSEGTARLKKIVDFLKTADRFHGAWSHWLNGATGEVIKFSEKDDGGDLIETAFLIQGLLTARQYLNTGDTEENQIIQTINELWEAVEWDWYRQDGQDVLYWHWSPNFGWEVNHAIQGYHEGLISYVLAAASPTHSITKEVYHNGWARNGNMVNGNTYYDTTLPLGPANGGPLFFAHYSFLGLNPHNLKDTYADYWQQNVNHTTINRAYSLENPKSFVGYGSGAWGLTASDNQSGYSAHSPNNDLGVITPTAAISSIPYTPEFSMEALKYFYYTIGDKLWGEYGFYDAYNITENWVASSYLAIDQGPIIVMMENHRSAMLWNLLMSAPEIQTGLDKLEFTY